MLLFDDEQHVGVLAEMHVVPTCCVACAVRWREATGGEIDVDIKDVGVVLRHHHLWQLRPTQAFVRKNDASVEKPPE